MREFEGFFPVDYKNTIICSLKNEAYLKTKFPRKKFEADVYCPETWFYYITQFGVIRHYRMSDGYLYDMCSGRITNAMIKTKYKVNL